jgi:polysaccharide export outer membrane protein
MFLLFTVAALAQGTAIQVGPGDVLKLEVYGEPNMGGEFTITEQGKGSIFCGTVDFTGLSLEQAEDQVEACFLDGWLVAPRVSLSVVTRRSSRIEIGGAVNRPGPYYLDAPTPLRMAPNLAGGVALDRSAGVIVLTRATGERIEVPVEDLDGQLGATELRAGDVVKIEQGKTVYVGGEVIKEGPVSFHAGITAFEAVMTAGGPSPLANLGGAWIVRLDPDGHSEKIEVNLRRVRKGKDPDPELKPGDTVTVPESPL